MFLTAPPSPPQNLRCPDITGRSVTLDWEIPAHNGGSEITGTYVKDAENNPKGIIFPKTKTKLLLLNLLLPILMNLI